MWKRTYLALLALRIFFAFQPSYLHPDENFQGPEVIAGSFFDYPHRRTWEWTVDQPIRSVFPLWPVYGWPMTILHWILGGESDGLVEPIAIYYVLRFVMATLSFVLEDWAIHELIPSPRYRQEAVLLVTSSYVTWTFQTHTFSNSVETLLVLWSLVLIDRIVTPQREDGSIRSSLVLGFLVVFGVFNRMTFPAFIMIPGLRLLPCFLSRPFAFAAITLSLTFWTAVATATDTAFYCGPESTKSFRTLYNYVRTSPVITPLNNLVYNTQTSNLAEHGLHPHYQHLIGNLPQLLGPALIVLVCSIYPLTPRKIKTMLSNPRLGSALGGILLLSLIPHQEPRFLLPCVPLLLTCLRLPTNPTTRRIFWTSWIIFNAALGILMGTFHQGGIIPAQSQIPDLIVQSLGLSGSKANNIEVFWWKTYPPPIYLLGPNRTNPNTNQSLNISTVTLMGIPQRDLVFMLMQHVPTCDPSLIERLSIHKEKTDVFVAAPLSAWRLEDSNASSEREPFYPPVGNFSFSVQLASPPSEFVLVNIATFRNHLNLDDLDFGEDGFAPTLKRVVGRRGLGVWKVERYCPSGNESA